MRTINQNGAVIVEAIKSIGEPVTVPQLVKFLSENNGEKAYFIRAVVEDTLNKGVEYGYIQRRQRKYFVDWPKLKCPLKFKNTKNRCLDKSKPCGKKKRKYKF